MQNGRLQGVCSRSGATARPRNCITRHTGGTASLLGFRARATWGNTSAQALNSGWEPLGAASDAVSSSELVHSLHSKMLDGLAVTHAFLGGSRLSFRNFRMTMPINLPNAKRRREVRACALPHIDVDLNVWLAPLVTVMLALRGWFLYVNAEFQGTAKSELKTLKEGEDRAEKSFKLDVEAFKESVMASLEGLKMKIDDLSIEIKGVKGSVNTLNEQIAQIKLDELEEKDEIVSRVVLFGREGQIFKVVCHNRFLP